MVSLQKGKASSFNDEDEIRIDTTALRCPVCFNIFSQGPRVLGCGHSFCSDCLWQIKSRDILQASCPICRIPFSKSKLNVKNYIVEEILTSLKAVPEDSSWTDKAKESQLKFAMARMKTELNKMSSEVNALSRSKADLEYKIRGLVAVIISMIILLAALLIAR